MSEDNKFSKSKGAVFQIPLKEVITKQYNGVYYFRCQILSLISEKRHLLEKKNEFFNQPQSIQRSC